MTPEQTISAVGLLLAIATAVCALALWALKLTIAPLQGAMRNLSDVIQRVGDELKEHATIIVDHGNRLVKIETVHEIDERRQNLGRKSRVAS